MPEEALMRHALTTVAALSLFVVLGGCSSSGRLGQMRFYPHDQDVIWQAANQAMVDLGARVVDSSPAMGVVVGRMQVVEVGMPITVEASVRGSSRNPSAAGNSGADVRISAFPPSDTEPDENLTIVLEDIEARYLELLDAAVARLQGMSRPPVGYR